MADWDNLIQETRLDVEAGVKAWTTVLSDTFEDNILYAYAKGSAMKKWDTPIDYVPVISDLDIHLMLKGSLSLFELSSHDFEQSLLVSKRYEDTFNELRPKALHTPRSQVMSIHKLKQAVEYVPPRKIDVRMLIGTFPDYVYPSNSAIRQKDLGQILDLEEYVLRIPSRLLDRTGLDYWSILREFTFRVSPTPIRLLTQNANDPLDLWSMNRTQIVQVLEDKGYHAIARHYLDYYQNGWNLFLSGFTSNEDYRKTIRGGYYTIKLCIEEAKKMT